MVSDHYYVARAALLYLLDESQFATILQE